MSPWFRRRRQAGAASPELAPGAPETAPEQGDQQPQEPQQELDPAGPLSPDRLDDALQRLRKKIPAPSEESPREPSA